MRSLTMSTVKGVVIAFALALAAVAWITVLVVTDADQDQQIRQAEGRAANLSLMFEEQIYRQVLSVDQTLRILKSDWERNPVTFDYTALQHRALPVSDLISQLQILDARGHVVAANRRDLIGSDLSGRRFFNVHRNSASQAPLITGPFQLNGTWSLNFSRRLDIDHGTFGGAVVATYELEGLTQDMAQANIGPRGIIMLVGADDGVVRAVSMVGMQEPGADIKTTPLFRALMQKDAAAWTGPSGVDRDVRIHAWRQIPGQDLLLVVGLDRNAALGGAETRRQEALVAATAVTLLVLMMAVGVAGMISAAALREQRLAQDREVLAAANLRLAEARERADEKSLQLGMTLAGMSDGISMFDAEARLVQWNDRYAELNGLPSEALRLGLPFEDVLRLRTAERGLGAVATGAEIARQAAAVRDPASPALEIWQRPDGSVIEMRRTWLPDGGLITLYTDITARKQVEDAQSRARERMEIAAQEKSRFVAIVSHEIRTPLNVALNSLSLLDQSTLNTAQRQLVSTGLLAGESLMGLLNDILDLSRMQVGRLQLRPAPFALRPMLRGIVEMFRHQAEERGVELSVVVAPSVPDRLITDSGRLRQALMNLVNNAAKFAEPGPASIRVAFATLNDEAVLRFAVRDRGPDIPDLARAGLFRPFSQLQQPGSTGTGLGLAICQLLANLLGGRIGCDNLQHGKEFWLTLPADVMDAPHEPAAMPATQSLRLPRTRILLVEDIEANQLIVATALRRQGHMVDVAYSGLETLQKIECNVYDIVLLDIFMPGIDGLETARLIRSLPNVARTRPIVALTANVSAEDKAAYLEAGMNDLVAKPVETAVLLQAIARHVWRGHAGQEPQTAPTGLAIQVALPTQAPARPADPLDADRIQSWRNGLRAAVSDALFADCLRQLREMIPALQTALELRRPIAIKRATHAMAGVAGNYGLAALEATIRSIATQPEALDPEAQADRISVEIDRAEEAIASLVQTEIA